MAEIAFGEAIRVAAMALQIADIDMARYEDVAMIVLSAAVPTLMAQLQAPVMDSDAETVARLTVEVNHWRDHAAHYQATSARLSAELIEIKARASDPQAV